MKIIVLGSGGVGGYYGARLLQAGHDVTFVARGAHAAAIKTAGLKIISVDGDLFIPPDRLKVSSNPSAPGNNTGIADLVILAVKATGTIEALELVRGNIGPETLFLPLQNGVDSEKIIGSVYGTEKVIGGTTFISSLIDAPGVIANRLKGRVVIGEMDGSESARAIGIREMFSSAGIECRVTSDIVRMKWRKLLWNVGANALSAILDCSARETLSFPGTEKIAIQAMTEALHVARANGIPLEDADVERQISDTQKGGLIVTSMAMDKRGGRETEIEIMNGRISADGEKFGIPTPANDFLTAIMRFYNGKVQKQTAQ